MMSRIIHYKDVFHPGSPMHRIVDAIAQYKKVEGPYKHVPKPPKAVEITCKYR